MEGVPGLLNRAAKHRVGLRSLATHGQPDCSQERRVNSDQKEPRYQKMTGPVPFNDLLHAEKHSMDTLKQCVDWGVIDRGGTIVIFGVRKVPGQRIVAPVRWLLLAHSINFQ